MPLRFPRRSSYGDGTIDAFSFDTLPNDGERPADPESVRFRSIAEIMLRGIHRCVAAEGWEIVYDRYDDGGFSGGNIERPGLKRMMEDIQAGKIDCVVVYKVDRLSRSLLDFARVMETFDKFNVSFVSVTQHFNTTHSMGRLTLNILLSFAQFEREIIGERIRDKLAAQCRRGQWTGGYPVLGYDVDRSERTPKLVINRCVGVMFKQLLGNDRSGNS